jgi:ribosomal protein S18 acetylase RimI-like enzyme
MEFRRLYTETAFSMTALSAVQTEVRMCEGPIWVATVNDEVIGTVSAVSNDKGLYLRGMAVLPEARGRAIGPNLLKLVIEYARKGGQKLVYLNTTPFLERAIRLYESFGFVRIDEEPQDFFGTPVFTMVKHLEPGNEDAVHCFRERSAGGRCLRADSDTVNDRDL